MSPPFVLGSHISSVPFSVAHVGCGGWTLIFPPLPCPTYLPKCPPSFMPPLLAQQQTILKPNWVEKLYYYRWGEGRAVQWGLGAVQCFLTSRSMVLGVRHPPPSLCLGNLEARFLFPLALGFEAVRVERVMPLCVPLVQAPLGLSSCSQPLGQPGLTREISPRSGQGIEPMARGKKEVQ